MNKIIFLIISSLAIVNNSLANQCNKNEVFAIKHTENNSQELEAIADNTNSVGKNIYNLDGNAEVYSNDYYISADNIAIDKNSKLITANNNVKIQTNGVFVTTSSAKLQQTKNGLSVNSKQINYYHKPTDSRGVASSFTSENEVKTLQNASYSTCPSDSKQWQIKASSIVLDSNKNKGIAKDVKMEFFGIPVFYFSKYEWVLEGRESGFLSPSFSSYNINSESGYQIDIPYYFNIDTDKDLTLTLKNLSTRGQVINGFYRQLLAKNKKDGYFDIEIEALNNDKKTNQDRWGLKSTYQQKIADNANLKININRVSDVNYLQEIKHNNTNSALKSDINLSYKKDGLSASIFNESEQLINNAVANYTKDLEISLAKKFILNEINFNASILSTSFAHKDNTKIVGDRTHIDLSAYRKFGDLAYSLTPHLQINTTNYNLKNSTNKKRTSYTAGVDYKLFLEREINLFKTDFRQTLTPRLSYLYTPKKSQSNLPEFGGSGIYTSYNGLFTGSNNSSIDRIASANDIILGLSSKFINNKTEDTNAEFSIARSYNIDNNSKSNIFIDANFSYKLWKLNNSWQYNNRVLASDTTVSYQKNGTNFITLGHHFFDDKKSASIHGSASIFGKTHIFAGANRSITEKVTNYQTIGFAIDGCCTTMRVAHFKKNNNGSSDSVIKFELIFKGLGSSDKKILSNIQNDIPNYLPDL